MILVVGGMASGKRSYVQTRFGYGPHQMADATLDEKPVVYNLQDFVRGEPGRAMEYLESLCQKHVVICNEVGSGVIPITPEDRAWREATGRLCNALAREAEQVVRLVAGVPAVIKG